MTYAGRDSGTVGFAVLHNMEIIVLRRTDIEETLDLFCRCFADDRYYTQLLGEQPDRSRQMRELFRKSMDFCIAAGHSIGIKDGERLVAFALLFDYNKTRAFSVSEFNNIFGASDEASLPYYEQLHKEILALAGDTMYLLSIAVSKERQNCGLASAMIDYILERYEGFNLVSDVSNEGSLAIYRKRKFEIKTIRPEYYYIVHRSESPVGAVDFSGEIKLLVPNCRDLERYNIAHRRVRERQYHVGFAVREDHGISCFVPAEGNICGGSLVKLGYGALLEYQRLLDLSMVDEYIRGDYVFYAHMRSYAQEPLYNSTLENMIPCRKTEWSLIPDVCVSIPVRYSSRELLTGICCDRAAKMLLKDMDFRTHYEAGVPSTVEDVDDLASFKRRIKRYYLGKLNIVISSEISTDNYSNIGAAIGPPAAVDMYISIDLESSCAVLTWYALSSPFLVSHLFDNIIRNQIIVCDGASRVNFYDHIEDRFGLIKRGTPKIFALFPCDRKRLSDSQLASLLAAETIYPEGENFGKIVDEEIIAAVRSKNGIGQYDRAFLCAYSNVALQFSEDALGSVEDRLFEESITLFYMELILFEEAAIHIADREIVNLFSSNDAEDPVNFLSKVDAIYDGYSKTIDFWDIKVNYPTSQRSIKMLREAFGLRGQLEEMKRNQEQLQTVFDTKCDLIDRKESKRMNTSLAIISVLAVFSAWIDGYDYTSTWNDLLSGNAIYIIQKALFVMILVTAGYAVCHLFGNKKSRTPRKRQEKHSKKSADGAPLR